MDRSTETIGTLAEKVREYRAFYESGGFARLNGLPGYRYRSRAFRHPVLTFEEPDMAQRLVALRELGCTLSDAMPDALDENENGVLIAPEGTRLLLLQTQL